MLLSLPPSLRPPLWCLLLRWRLLYQFTRIHVFPPFTSHLAAPPLPTSLVLPAPAAAMCRCSTRNTVYEVLKSRPGWVETHDDVDWDLCWADVGWVRDMYDQIQVWSEH